MPVVLGIDAAWTENEPSGVALVSGHADRWRCLAVAPSYAAFLRLARGNPVDWAASVEAGVPDARLLLEAAYEIAAAKTNVVAIDMPIAHVPITGRRAADDAITREFGRQGCGTHSPSVKRPGPLGERLRAEFGALGFELGTTANSSPGRGRLIEVYPHVALLKLLSEPYRLKCKVSRMGKYWPNQNREQRVIRLLEVWCRILDALRLEFDGLSLSLPAALSVRAIAGLKRYEDALDALVSAWVGARFVEGRAQPYGDETAAIWVPCGRGRRPRTPPASATRVRARLTGMEQT